MQATKKAVAGFLHKSGLAPMSIKKLGPGEYLGLSHWQKHLSGLVLTLSSYRPGLEQSWHAHTRPTIFLLLDGTHHDRSPRQTWEQAELTAIFHPVTEPHATEVGPDGMLGLNVEYPHEWLSEYGLRFGDLGGCRMLDSASSRLTVLRLLGALLEAGPSAVAELESAAFELLDHCVVLARLPHQSRAPVWLSRVDEYLRAAFQLPISLRDVAHEVGVHPVHCARVFRRHRGCSVGLYLRMLRLISAGQLVVCRGQSLSQAAYRVGFADQPHFTRLCRRALGFSPKTLARIRRGLVTDIRGFNHSRFAHRQRLH
jgi:AraC family transcriptional regulator